MNRQISQKQYARIFEELEELSHIGCDPTGGISRLAYTSADRAAKNYITALFQQEGLEVWEDAAGNIIARRQGNRDYLPAVACGSHLDSVINGGKYDGTLGVLAGLEVIRRLNYQNIVTEHPLEIMVFACEESARFGVSTIGSKAMAGKLDLESLAHVKDSQGISFAKAVADHGLHLPDFSIAKRDVGELHAFVELHIEQGPVLEKSGLNIGIVTAIAAPARYRLRIEGVAGHSGTTIMNLRHDALVAASEIILSVENIALQETDHHLVGTVGVIKAYPGSTNTIPGLVEVMVEFRSDEELALQKAQQKFLTTLRDAELRRGVTIDIEHLSFEQPVALDKEMAKLISENCRQNQYAYQEMVSGAGHDAMNMAALCPVGLIFVPSINGISHHPEERTQDEHILIGIDLLYKTILDLAKGDVDR